MISSFQFRNPSLLKLSFEINSGFEKKENTTINIGIENQVEIGPGIEENSAVVILKLTIGRKNDSTPFYIYAEEGAEFMWDSTKVDKQHSDRLLKQNAPALLLSYLRPVISMITSASPFASYNIPFMNFKEEK